MAHADQFVFEVDAIPCEAAKRRPRPPGEKVWRLACPKSDLNLVFPTRNGTVLAISHIHRTCWRPLLRAAGLIETTHGREAPRYRFHDIRHVAASLFIEQGWQPKKIMELMGHSSIQMTFDRYGHLWKTVQDDAAGAAQIEKRLLG